MKKILLTFILALTAFFVEAQLNNTFPAPGTNPTTRQTNPGGYWPQLLLQPPTFSDTTAANNGKTNFYAGSIIFTLVDGNYWYRNASATRWVLFTPQFNVCAGLISGGIVTLNTGLLMNVTAATYCINNTTYNSPATTLTLATADPSLPRIDRIVGDITGNAVVITGTPAVNPVAPFVNPVTQVAFSSVLIPAGDTTPANINRYIIYNENAPPDWTGSSNLLAGAVNFASTTLPYIGTIDADVDSGTVGEIIFTSTDTLDLQNENVLQQFIRLKSAYPATSSISVAFKLGTDVVSNYVTLNPSNGFTKSIAGSYQNISIPFSQLIFTGGTLVNGYVIKLTGPSSGFYLDYIQLQNSVIPNQDDQFVAKYRRDTITAPKTLTDSLLLKTITLATNTSIPQSPVLSIESPTFDTTSGISRIAKWRIKAQGTRGSSTVNSLFTIGTPTLNVISAQQDGVVSFWNGASMFKTGSTPSIGGNGLVFSSSLASAPFAFRGTTGATLTGNFFDVASGSSYVLSNTANAFNFTGDAGQVLLRAKPSGPVSIGTTTNDYLTLDVGRIGTGMRGPSMNTLQRDGMNKNVATVTVTNPGSGYTLGIPTFSVTSPSGGLDAKFLATVTAGSVSALTILFPGNGYPSGGSLTVNNTGTGGSGAAATYTVSTGTIPTGAMIYNTDSLCYQSYNGSSWVNMREGSGGGGGSVGTLQQVTDLGAITTNELTVQNARVGTNGFSTFFGVDALTDNTSSYSVGIGYGALAFASGTQNIGIGVNAAQGSVGNGVVGIGRDAGINNVGNRNVFIGNNAGDNQAGSGVIGIGIDALSGNGLAGAVDHVVAIGDSAGYFNEFSNVSIIGTFATADSTNQVVLSDGVHQVRLDHALLTGDIKPKWQNRSGIIAYTDDISPDTVVNLIYPLRSQVVGASINQFLDPDFLDSVRPKYKVYTARISQTGTSAPTEDYVYENTLGSPTWSRTGTGEYTLTITGAFISGKTTTIQAALPGPSPEDGIKFMSGQRVSDNAFDIKTGDGSALSDGCIVDYTIEIRVYY